MKKDIALCFILLLLISCKEQQKGATESAKQMESTPQTIIKSRILADAILAGGTLRRIDSFPSQFIVPRAIDIWLPEDYTTDKKYNVLYMHDGQNLFDATTTWNKQEWRVDEWVTALMKVDSINDLIVVGVHNIPKIRFLDLFPEKALGYLSEKVKDSLLEDGKKQDLTISFEDFKGDEYLKFMVEELKPYIDKTYTTKSARENTFIGGSSMGGLMSMYAMCEYPEVFTGAACISTHWSGMNPTKHKNPVAKSILAYMEANLPSSKEHTFYFDYGTETLDAFYPKYLVDVDKIFSNKGYTSENYMNLEFEGADHSEDSWNRRFDIPLLFLLKK